MVICVVKNCGNYEGNLGISPDLRFYAFPNDSERFKLWRKAAGCGALIPDKRYYVCSIHFDISAIRLQDRLLGTEAIRRKLSEDAVPTLFLTGSQQIADINAQPVPKLNKLEATCRLCDKMKTGIANIFEDNPDNGEASYSIQIQEMFQIALPDNPDWPRSACWDCISFLDDMKSFKKRIIDRHFILEETFQKSVADTNRLPIECVFVGGDPVVGMDEENETSMKAPNRALPNDTGDEDALRDVVGEAISSDVGPGDNLVGNKVEEDEASEEGESPGREREEPKTPHRSKAKEGPSAKKCNRHMLNKIKEAMKEMGLLKCHVCAQSEDNLKDLLDHCRDEHEKKVLILCCDRQFTYPSHIIYDHIELHLNPLAFRCRICDKVCQDSRILKRHHNSFHPTGESPHKCPYCDYRGYSRSLIAKHVRRIHEKAYSHVCDLCGKAFTDLDYLKQHRSAHQKAAKREKPIFRHSLKGRPAKPKAPREDALEQCDICGKWYTNVRQHKYKIHRTRHLYRHKCGKDKLVCDKCGRYFSKLTFQLHFSRCGNPPAPPDAPVKCNVCERMCSNRTGLKKHMHYHTQARRFECPHCEFKSISMGNRWRHIRYSHPEEYKKCLEEAAPTAGNLECSNQSIAGDEGQEETETIIEEGIVIEEETENFT